ncbi:MAG TPA: fibronectin type III domain-containing protein, partial [Acidimicrobiales bacterium]|nr:fibronectin type III domain-containing protein [Acidimicrobiales bacterium]
MTDSSPPPQPAFGETTERRPTPGFGAVGLLVGILAVVVVVGGLVGLAVAGTATPASRVHLLGGSIVLPDNRPLTVVNRATGQPTAQLQGVNSEVGAPTYSDVQAVPFDGGTLLVNRQTGTFNLLQADNYVADRAGRGVGLGPLKGTTSAAGYAAGSDAYILRRSSTSTVSLVDAHTVTEAADNANASNGSKAPTNVAPVGFAKLPGLVTKAFGTVAVARRSLWALVQGAGNCQLVAVAPSPSKNGALPTSVRAHPANCATSALASDGSGTVGLAVSGQVSLYSPTDSTDSAGSTGSKAGRPSRAAQRAETVPVPALAKATRILPVTGAQAELWYLADTPSGWEVVGVDPATRTASAKPVKAIPAAALPAPPVISGGQIYTLPRLQNGHQPPLWVIDPATGAVGTVKGATTYPTANRTEHENFGTAGVVVSGPRVVFNNPGSLLAVMVFTDGSHKPVRIAKSAAPDIVPNGPAQVTSDRAAQTHGKHGHGHGAKPRDQQGTTPPTTAPAPKPVPDASPTVNCATTTEKPYAPTGLSVSPSSESAMVRWHYNLLTDADCQPQTWTVTLTANGAPQPSNPVQTVNGLEQLDVTGLRPSTTYTAVVTAYIRTQSTRSDPIDFKTAAQAADPPTSVTAHVTPTGSWVVDWTACHRADCYTPAAKWVVTGTACGGSFAGTAPSAQVAGTQSSVTFDAASLGRLGQSLRFSVQGVSALGLPGNPVSESTCLQSWRPPQRGAIALAASGRAVGSHIDAT